MLVSITLLALNLTLTLGAIVMQCAQGSQTPALVGRVSGSDEI